MYFVYYRDHIINFTDRPALGCDGVVTLEPGEAIGTAKMLEKLENSKNLCILSPDPQKAFSDFAARFTHVEAAGGVARNARGEVLMIYRNNRWDLPKGHVEPGESVADAAVREVCEETGLEHIELGEIIVTTHHFYLQDGKWIMKRTWWFSMSAEGDPVPQTEEGITRAEWVASSRVPGCAEQSFASVKEVLKLARTDEQNIINLQNILP